MDEASGLLIVGVAILLAIFFASYIPCLIVARYTQRSETRGWPAVLTCIILAGFPLLFLLAGWPGTDGEPLVYAAPIYVPITFAASILLARWMVTTYWWQALLLALAGLVGHLVIGWPSSYLPVKYQDSPTQGAWEKARVHLGAQAKARPLLKEYGLKLPLQYQVIYTKSPEPDSYVGDPNSSSTDIFIEPRHTTNLFREDEYFTNYHLGTAPLESWLTRMGYKLASGDSNKSLYTKDGLTILIYRKYDWWLARSGMSLPLCVRLSLASGTSALVIMHKLDPASEWKPLLELKGGTEAVQQVAYYPDGRTLVSSSEDGTVRIWPLNESSPSPAVLQRSSSVNALAVSPDGETLAAGCGDGTVSLWDTADPLAAPEVLVGYDGVIYRMAISPDGKWLVVGGTNKALWLWDMAHLHLQPLQLNGHTDWAGGGVFSPDSQLLATWGADRTIRLWDMQSPRQALRVIEAAKSVVGPAVFSPDGKLLVAGGAEGIIRIWKLQQPRESVIEFRAHNDWLYTLALTPDGNKLVSGSYDGRIIVWDIQQRPPAAIQMSNLQYQVRAVAVSPDGKQLASGIGNGTIQLWSLEQSAVRP